MNKHVQRTWPRFTPIRGFIKESAFADAKFNRSLHVGRDDKVTLKVWLSIRYDSVIPSAAEESIKTTPQSGSTLTMPTGHGFVNTTSPDGLHAEVV